jgi:hypothetical protein
MKDAVNDIMPRYARDPAQELSDRIARAIYNRVYPFYRAFPHHGPVSLFQIEHRGAYSPPDRFFYNRVPKAANTSVIRMLASNSSYCRPRAGKGDKRRMLRPQLMSAADVRALTGPDTFRFTIVRNPFTRVLSAYLSKILLQKNSMRLRRFARMMDTDPATPPDFTKFCRFLANGGVWRDAHWAPQWALMLLPAEMYHHIGRVETLDDDLALVASRIWGADAIAPAPRLGMQTNSGDALVTYYTDEAHDIVARLYSEDFRRFGYGTYLP